MQIEEIKSYMKMNGITYEELADKSGISISAIKKIFSGHAKNPRYETIQAIESALGLHEKEAPDYSEASLRWEKAKKQVGITQADINSLNDEELLTILNVAKAFFDKKGKQ